MNSNQNTRQMRSKYLVTILAIAIFLTDNLLFAQDSPSLSGKRNLAVVATATSAARYGPPLQTLNDGLTATSQGNNRGNRTLQPRTQHWVQYEWSHPVTTREIAIYWSDQNGTLRLPLAYRIHYWDGEKFAPVKNPAGLGIVNNQFNNTTFDEIKTTRVRVELDSADRLSSTLLEWVVYQSENSISHPPVVNAGPDRDVMAAGKTYLNGSVRSVTPVTKIVWTKVSGPGAVQFSDPSSATGTACSISG